MSAPVKLALFGALLALVFAGSALAGSALGPEPEAELGEPAHAGGGHDEPKAAAHGAVHQVRGLATEAGGLRLVVDDPELRRGHAETLRFRIVDGRGATVRDFDVEHTKRMHLILARRDLTGFQHLHPRQRADGAWVAETRLAEAGSYRLLADFSRGGEPQTLASDLRVDGAADLRPLPAPVPVTVSDGGSDVRRDAAAVRAGAEAELRFRITRGGEPIATEPYLGAGGHLVALREGDLAFLHVHPTEGAGGGEIGFAATFPTAGRYRLFLQFQHDGRVETVAFTQAVR